LQWLVNGSEVLKSTDILLERRETFYSHCTGAVAVQASRTPGDLAAELTIPARCKRL
jgi:hypothetical protein